MRTILAAVLLWVCLAPRQPSADEICPIGPDSVEMEAEANFDLNQAAYFIEVGTYYNALEAYDAAFALSLRPETKARALSSKAALLAAYLDEPDKALELYETIIRTYPQQAEAADYRRGFLLFELERFEEAAAALENHLREFPGGAFRMQAEALTVVAKRRLQPAPKPLVVVQPATDPPELRVRLTKQAQRVDVRGRIDAPTCLETGETKRLFRVEHVDGRLFLDGRPMAGSDVTFSAEGPLEPSYKGKTKPVRGEIKDMLDDCGLTVINLVDMESYLRGVIPAEVYASWRPDALKAQAVAARTYALYQKNHRTKLDFDLVDHTGDQAYKGLAKEHPATDKAVAATVGEVLTHDGKPILAMYTANSGGHIADAGAVFDLHKPYLRARSDPASLSGKMARWTRTHSLAEIEAALAKRGIWAAGLEGLEPVRLGPSGRVISLRLNGCAGDRVLRTRKTLKRALKLPEIFFQTERRVDAIVFHGRGHGHGVGFSQWGAAKLAETKQYSDILAFNYPGTKLTTAW